MSRNGAPCEADFDTFLHMDDEASNGLMCFPVWTNPETIADFSSFTPSPVSENIVNIVTLT